METTPTPNTTLSHESQAAIRKMLLSLDALCGNNSLWKYEELERAMEQMFQGDFSVPSISRPRLKLAYLIIRRQILHLLTLEKERAEWEKDKSEREKEKEETTTPTPQSSRHIITPKPLSSKSTSLHGEPLRNIEEKNPPLHAAIGEVWRSREGDTKMPQGITHQPKGITPSKGKQLKINSPPISIKN